VGVRALMIPLCNHVQQQQVATNRTADTATRITNDGTPRAADDSDSTSHAAEAAGQWLTMANSLFATDGNEKSTSLITHSQTTMIAPNN
jgi:hypothetical protein